MMLPATSSSRVVRAYTFPKNPNEEVVAELTDYQGRQYANVRVHWRRGSELLPTKKGITIDADQLPDLERAVDALILAATAAPPHEEG